MKYIVNSTPKVSPVHRTVIIAIKPLPCNLYTSGLSVTEPQGHQANNSNLEQSLNNLCIILIGFGTITMRKRKMLMLGVLGSRNLLNMRRVQFEQSLVQMLDIGGGQDLQGCFFQFLDFRQSLHYDCQLQFFNQIGILCQFQALDIYDIHCCLSFSFSNTLHTLHFNSFAFIVLQ